MKLVYKQTGEPVRVGDTVETTKGEVATVSYFAKPHKSSSEGKISLKTEKGTFARELYVSCIGAEWIEREDRGWKPEAVQQPKPKLGKWSPGKMLPNGATIIAINRDCVLAVREHSYDPYVTWAINNETGACHWGHYFRHIDYAIIDFKERSE